MIPFMLYNIFSLEMQKFSIHSQDFIKTFPFQSVEIKSGLFYIDIIATCDDYTNGETYYGGY